MRKKVPQTTVLLLLTFLVLLTTAQNLYAADATLLMTELPANELYTVQVSQNTPIIVGVIPSYAPDVYFDSKTGCYEGIFMEILKEVSTRTGLQFEYRPIDLTQGAPITQLKQGKFDLVAGILKTENFLNDKELFLSETLIYDSLSCVCRKNEDFTLSPNTSTLALQTGFQVAEEFADTQFPNHKKNTYTSLAECVNAVASRRADATIYLHTCLNHLLQNPHYSDLEILPAYSLNIEKCVAGLSDKQSNVINVINKGLAQITEKERNALIMNATIAHPYKMTIGDIFYKYRIPVIIIVALLFGTIGVLVATTITRTHSWHQLQLAVKKEQEAIEKEKQAIALAKQASEAKANFMSRMSHEIRTPLNAIIGYNTIATNAINDAKTDAEFRQMIMKTADCLSKSNIASKHLLSIINDILDMSAIETGKIKITSEKFDFKSLISSLTTIFYSQAKTKGIQFEVLLSTFTEEWFIGDPNRVNQVLTNLLSNAIKFTPEGGTVKLSIEQTETSDTTARVHFDISDTGIGISDEYLAHIWTPFDQADSSRSRRFGGAGLGLSISKNLLDLMNGSIQVESKQNEGTTFKVDISFGRTEQPATSASYDFKNMKALIVDDDVSTCDYMKLLFDRFGAKCKTVTTGVEAIQEFSTARKSCEPYTICLVDWRMPVMDGLETIKCIKNLAEDELPIIVISAYDFTEIADKASEAGITKFLSKPLFQSSLFDLLVNICGKVEQSKEDEANEVKFNNEKVLLVEDNEMNMEIARNLLASVGLVVESAWNGKEAFDKFESAPEGTYKVILMDIQMPVMDGHTSTRLIRASSHPDAKKIPIIAMTADAFPENVAESKMAGMNDHIAKPIDLPKLYNILNQYIKGAQID